MANNTPTLNLIILDTHSKYTLAVADASEYPVGFVISTPTLEITVPNYDPITIPFVEKTIQLYNSKSLELVCKEDEDCDNIPLPDGIWKIKYSIYPAYKYYVVKTFIRVDYLQEKLDDVYMKMDLMQCDRELEIQDRKYLDTAQAFIEGAVAAANKCADKLAMNLYRKAERMIKDYLNHRCNGVSQC